MIATAPLDWAAAAFSVAAHLATESDVQPTPSPTELPYNPDDVTPGVVGFLFTFVIFVLVALLCWDLIRRVRRVKYRAEIRERLEAELAEREAAGEGADAAAATDGPATGRETGGEASGGSGSGAGEAPGRAGDAARSRNGDADDPNGAADRR